MATGRRPAPPADAARRAAEIFRLYEENIGPLTPLIAETLGEAEDTYPRGVDRRRHAHRRQEQQTHLALCRSDPGALAARRTP